MILGSTVVYVNGETADCGVAPELIYYKDTDEYAVLLPAYFVANVFGYEYEWDGTSFPWYVSVSFSPFLLKEQFIP